MHTMLRHAAIYSDFETEVKILPLGTEAPDHLHWSHGACFESWRDASPEELVFFMFQVFATLVLHGGLPAGVVHRAFCAIPEYRAYLPPDHPDVLTSEEWLRLRDTLDLPRKHLAA